MANFSIVFASFCALFVGFLVPVQPTFWAPHLRAELRSRRSDQRALRLLSASLGQALTTSLVALLVTILAFATIAVADASTPVWAGSLVCAIAVFHFVRRKAAERADPDKLRGLLDANRAGQGKDPFGPHEKSPWETVRATVFAPGFAVSPFFLAAAGSGLPSVTNGLPVVLAFVVGGFLGALAAARGLRAKLTGGRAREANPRDEGRWSGEKAQIVAAGLMFVSGVLTAISG